MCIDVRSLQFIRIDDPQVGYTVTTHSHIAIYLLHMIKPHRIELEIYCKCAMLKLHGAIGGSVLNMRIVIMGILKSPQVCFIC